jgi:hypothetical protein
MYDFKIEVVYGLFNFQLWRIYQHFHIVKMYKDKEVKKNVKDIFSSMCDVKIILTFTFDLYTILF